ncbi:MAG: quinolinate synthase [Clostridiales bacterium]|nr:quinolinate synthase [Clostridiales bacterium]MDN5282053.1 quinolinate synthase [Candidatus Ozemobacter sp.]
MLSSADFQNRLIRYMPEQKPEKPDKAEKDAMIAEIRRLLKEKNAVLITHYYTDPEIQKLAEETGGFIGDSLEMARFGAGHSAETLVIVGVRFMGESAKILSPQKTILMPSLEAECSLDIGCEPEEFRSFCEQNSDRTVVVYANTSAAVKALADWTVTSSIAVDVVKHLAQKGEKIIWAPDRFLGDYIKRNTNADMLLWNAYCIVHAEFDAAKIEELKQIHSDAEVLVHPESQPEVIALADVVGSTSQLLKASQQRSARKFIVATETGILYKMQQASPEKEFIFAPTSSVSSGISCEADCPWMKMNTLQNLLEVLQSFNNRIELPDDVIKRALIPLERMVNFRK